MRKRLAIVGVTLFLGYSCASSQAVVQPQQIEQLHGIASWYGQEFAGRTTANGEIFDPMLLTAAHRTLPFGTVVDVRNPKNGQLVRVRINDRGPFVGDRMIDLSYAAAQQIGLIEPGKGDVDVTVVKVGNGEREPPAPYVVTIADAPAAPVPAAPAPKPAVVAEAPPKQIEATPEGDGAFGIEVVEVHRGVETRRQVSADGKTVENVPLDGSPAVVASAPGHGAASQLDEQLQTEKRAAAANRIASATEKFFVQVGAFSIETNAKLLQDRLTRIGQRSFVEHNELYRVRMGPFETREDAIRARTSLEESGISAIIVAN
ncbi:MAG TPA: septal ring lytic transglycosylase RlpA family protein [Thermoanaerobaculia bacterium]|jgi:rare lipoprotein A|nr:septal ring lytic transglycosylase RlpA family protein [Thermoanaerobaculia bacterium]